MRRKLAAIGIAMRSGSNLVSRESNMPSALVVKCHRSLRQLRSWQKVFATGRALVLTMSITFLSTGDASATTNFFDLFGSVCVAVHSIENGSRAKLRDDIGARIVPVLLDKIRVIQKFRTIRSRPDCLKPDALGFERQLMLELYVKLQIVDFENKNLKLAIIGGYAPNAGGLFADYELQPMVILKTPTISDDEIDRKLIEYVERNLLSLLRR
jgi:hypothetical protein